MNIYLAQTAGIIKAPQMLSVREAEVSVLREKVKELQKQVKSLKIANFLRLGELSEYRIYIQDLLTALSCLSEAVLSGETELAQHHAHKAQQLIKVIEREV